MQDNLIPTISEEPFIPNLAEPEKYTGIFGYRAQDKRLTLTKGQLYALISISGPAGFPAQLTGKYIWEAVSDKYYFNSKGKPAQCLKDAIKAGRNRLISILKSNESFVEKGVEINMVTVVVWSEFLYVAMIGNPVLNLLRGDRLIDIGTAFNDPKNTSLVNVGSGRLEPNDLLLLGSPKLEDRVDDYVDFVKNGQREFTYGNVIEWFSKETALFDPDEGLYLLGFNLDEEHISTVVPDGEEVLEGYDEGQESLGMPEQPAGTKGFSVAGIKTGLLGALSGVTAGFSKAAATAAPMSKKLLGKAKDVAGRIRPNKSGVMEDNPELAVDAYEPIDQDMSDNPSEDTPIDIEAPNQTSDQSEQVESTEEESLPVTRSIPEETQTEYSAVAKSRFTKEMISRMSFHEKLMYKKEIEAFEQQEQSRETEQNLEVSQMQEESVEDVPVEQAKTVDVLRNRKASIFDKAKLIAVSQVRKIFALFSKIKLVGDTKQYFVGKRPESYAKYILIGIAVLILLFVVIKRISDARAESDLKTQYDTEISELNKKITQAEGVLVSNPGEAREDLLAALEQSKKIEKIDYQANKAKEKTTKIQGLLDDIEKKVGLSESTKNFEILFDAFTKYGEDAQIDDVAISGDVLYMTDSKNSSVYTYNYVTGSKGKIPDSSETLKKPLWIEVGDLGNVFIYDQEEGMVVYNPDNGEIKTLGGLSPRQLNEVTEFGVYSKDENLYFLNAKDTRLYKAKNFDSGYGAPEEYILFASLSTATDVAIDGNIYMAGTGTGDKLFKFFGDTRDRMAVKGLYDELGEVSGIFKTAKFTKLYILDAEVGRLVILDPPGSDVHPGEAVLEKQYVYRGKRKDVFKEPREIVVTSNKKTAFVLENNRIYKITLE